MPRPPSAKTREMSEAMRRSRDILRRGHCTELGDEWVNEMKRTSCVQMTKSSGSHRVRSR
jgi:hypothetical protein